MENLILESFYLLIIMIAGIGASLLWRTSIYTRGAIFRPIGRILDRWVANGNKASATFWDKLLRFMAYPLGRCVYCSSFHIMYDMFFILNWKFELGLSNWYLLILLPISHLFVILTMRILIEGNDDLAMGDWDYMKDSETLFDFKRRASVYNSQKKLSKSHCQHIIPTIICQDVDCCRAIFNLISHKEEILNPLSKEDEAILDQCKSGAK